MSQTGRPGREYDPQLSEGEEREVEEASRPSAPVIHEVIRAEGEQELERRPSALMWSGFASGLSMGFSVLAIALVRSSLPDTPWRHVVASFGYCVGFIIVVMGRQQLFTENTLTPVLPLLAKPSWRMFWRLLRLWGVVLASNLAGAFLFAWVASHSDAFHPEVRRAMLEVGREALQGGAGLLLIRGIFAGWLIALMVWLLPTAGSARLWVIVMLSYLVSLAGLAHVIVGSVEVMFLSSSGAATWVDYVLGFLLPVLVGNTIGGVLLVALINHGQVVQSQK